MRILHLSFLNPIATMVTFAIVLMLGLGAMSSLPVQLTPDIKRPEVTILNFWRAAAPAEMESAIVEPQENVLENITGLKSIRSSVRAGFAMTTLEFPVGTDMSQVFSDVINALNQTPGHPREASEPIVQLGGLEQPLATLILRKADTTANSDFTRYQSIIDSTVAPPLRQIEGIAKVRLDSEREKQLQVIIDPYKLAALNISLSSIMQKLRDAVDTSGGFAEVGRREYTVRFAGQYVPDALPKMILAYDNGRPVYLSEVAEVKVGFEERRGFAYRNGSPGYYIQLMANNNANTVSAMTDVNRTIDYLNETILAEQGLILELSYDASVHIKRAIALVKSNLGMGIVLALAVLYVMLRGIRPTLLIALSIPVSLSASLLVLGLLERSFNIISLAGLAFAVGIVLDAAIVVQENIAQKLQIQARGNLKDAVIKGTSEVVPALFASTVTTVAIFTPILFLGGVEGQLFFDLAISMAVAVIASMLTALFLLPVLAYLFMAKAPLKHASAHWTTLAKHYAGLMSSRLKSASWVALLLPGALLLSWVLMPQTDFMPEAKWEGVVGVISTPPGANPRVLEEEIGKTIVRRLEPHRTGKKKPYIRDYNVAMSAGGNVVFVYPEDPKEAKAVLSLVQTDILANLPDTRGFAYQASLLSLNVGGNRTIYLNFNGNINETTRLVARRTMAEIQDAMPGTMVRPLPGLSDKQPELLMMPNDEAIAEAGLTRSDVATLLRAVTDGAYSGEYFDGTDRMDIIVKAETWSSPGNLAAIPVATNHASVQTLGQLTTIERKVGPTRLRRFNGERALTLAVTPPDNISLEKAIATLNTLTAKHRAELPAETFTTLSGGADDLDETISTMTWNFMMAVIVLFMLLFALFRSLKDAAIVVSAIPLSLAGGVLGLAALNAISFQALDLLTMIGFVILMGLVVNNAILLVDAIRRAHACVGDIDQAIRLGISQRVRPIYMSTLTSVVGMLPLAIIPGVGSEIYRGLATVIAAGMLASTLFSCLYIPAAIRLTTRSNQPAPAADTLRPDYITQE